MPITSSVIVEDSPQIDGRRYVAEQHTDHVAKNHFNRYKAEAGADVNAAMLARVPSIEEGLADQEANSVVDMFGVALVLNHQTTDQFLARFRARYLVSTGTETCQLARWLVDALDRGDVSVVQCHAAWGVSPAVWNGINGRMDTYASAWSSVLTAVGE